MSTSNRHNPPKSRRSATSLIVTLVIALLVVFCAVSGASCTSQGNSSSAASSAASTVAVSTSSSQASSASAQAPQSQLTFRNKNLLKEHYKKHGKAMGYADSAAYVAGANAVIDNPDSLHKTQKEDGDDVYYLEATDEIVIVSGDGYIRTYFNPGGIDYYNRQ